MTFLIFHLGHFTIAFTKLMSLEKWSKLCNIPQEVLLLISGNILSKCMGWESKDFPSLCVSGGFTICIEQFSAFLCSNHRCSYFIFSKLILYYYLAQPLHCNTTYSLKLGKRFGWWRSHSFFSQVWKKYTDKLQILCKCIKQNCKSCSTHNPHLEENQRKPHLRSFR